MVPALLAALALSLSLSQTGAAARPHGPHGEEKAATADHTIRLGTPKLVTPNGHAKPQVSKTKGPLSTIPKQQLAALKNQSAQTAAVTGAHRPRKAGKSTAPKLAPRRPGAASRGSASPAVSGRRTRTAPSAAATSWRS